MSNYRGKPLEFYSKTELIEIIEEQMEMRINDHKEFRKDLDTAYSIANPGPGRNSIGWVLAIWGFVILGIFLFGAMTYRYQHEKMTETELTLWALQQWTKWMPGALMVAAGLLMANWRRKEKK